MKTEILGPRWIGADDYYVLRISEHGQGLAIGEDNILQLNGVIPDLAAKIMQRRANEKSDDEDMGNVSL